MLRSLALPLFFYMHTPAYVALISTQMPITHTAVDVERSFSFYKLARSEKQLALTDQHHIGRISFAMNGLVPPVQP